MVKDVNIYYKFQKKEPSFDGSQSEATTRFELVIRVLQTTPLYAKKSHIYRHCSHFSNRRPPYAPPYFSCHYCTPESDLFQTLYPTYMEETWNIN